MKNLQDNPAELKEPRTPGRAKLLGPKQKRFTKKQKIITGLIVLFVLLVASYLTFFKSDMVENPVKISTPTLKTSPSGKTYSPLTGSEVTEEQASRPLTAIMIENSVDARPQSGLTDAGVVFEAIAEGGITRFATIYQENTPPEVGPVRSLRPYYLDWLHPFKATIAHVGGSQKALKQVRDGSWKDMDQFSNGKSFWRSTQRKAPHNVYTSFDKIDAFNQTKRYVLEDFQQLTRKDDQKSTAPNTTTINLNISSKLYNSVFTYNSDTNTYLRAQGGAPHKGKDGKQIEPKTLVVLIENYSIVQEDGSRSAYKTTGSGEAYVFQDGIATQATWNKPTQSSQIKLQDLYGKDVKLNRGQTWFTILGDRSKLSYQ